MRLLAANTNVTEPPTGLTNAGATISTSTAVNLIANGFIYAYGLIFNAGDAGSGDQCQITWGSSNSLNHGQIWEKCTVNFGAVSGISKLNLGAIGTNVLSRVFIDVKDLTISHETAGSQVIELQGGHIYINGLTTTGTPNASALGFFTSVGSGRNSGGVLIENFDVSATDLSASALMGVAGITDRTVIFRNGKIPDDALTIGTFPGMSSMRVMVHNVDSGDSNYRLAQHTWQGSTVTQTVTRIRSGGATTKAGTAYSWLMTGTANTQLYAPLVSPEISKYNATVGSAITATIEILHDSLTNLQDDDIWVEINYLGTSGVPLGTLISDRMTNVLSTPVDQTSSSVTWDTTSMTNPNKQKLAVTFTPQEAGYINAKVMFNGSTTVYVDPVITIS